MMTRFESDYLEGAHPDVLRALIETNGEQTPGYGEDPHCEAARALLRERCALPEGEVQFLVGGTQVNRTVIASILRPHQGVVAADTGHIAAHETGAIENSGHKVLTVPNTEAYWLAMAGTYMVLPMRSCSLNDVRPFDPPEITAEALVQALAEPKSREQVRQFFASLGMEITEEEARHLQTGEPFLTDPGKPEIQTIDADLSDGKALALVKTSLYSFLLETRADGKTVLLDMLTEFDAMRTERIGRTTWLVGRMGGPLDGGRGEYVCWYNLETRGADILYAEFTVESYMGGSLCTGTWASEDCLIYALTEETQTEGESVAVTSQITIEGIRGLYTAKDIQRESLFEKTLRREYVYDASRGRLVIAGAQ